MPRERHTDTMSDNVTKAPKVLIVEDDACAAFLLKTMLKKDGYQVQHCGDGEAALQMLAGNSFDAVVLDLMMPKVDGMQVLKEMRSNSLHLLTPVILLTAAKLKIIEDQAARYFVRYYLEKTEIPKLREGLRVILSENSSPEASRLRMAETAPLEENKPAADAEQKPAPSKGLARLFSLDR